MNKQSNDKKMLILNVNKNEALECDICGKIITNAHARLESMGSLVVLVSCSKCKEKADKIE